jgi:hypothetical protein
MLRITVHEESTVWRLSLSGKLAGPWVAETENVWRSAPSSGTQIEVDLKDVTGVDTAGRRLLAAMHGSGARLLPGGVANCALVSEIARRLHPCKASPPRGSGEGGSTRQTPEPSRRHAAESGTAENKTQEGDK